MAVTIEIKITDECNEQMELMCKLNSTNKDEWVIGLIRDEMAVFFKNRKEKKMQEELDQNNSNLRTSWELGGGSNNNLIPIGRSIVFPPAY